MIGRICAFAFAAVISVSAFAADWTEPKDGKLTEKQVQNYIALNKDLIATFKDQNKKIDDAKTDLGKLTIAMSTSNKLDELVTKYNMTREEWSWVQMQVLDAWVTSLSMDLLKNDVQKEMAKGMEDMNKQAEVLSKTIAACETAIKEGKRVLTDDQRKEIVQSAKDEEKEAKEEAKTIATEISDVEKEAKAKEAEASEAKKLAANPPKDLDPEEREEFVNDKKEEAENAANDAKEIRENIAELKKNAEEANARATAAGKRAANPDVPATDEEKKQVQAENQQNLENAKQQLTQLNAARLQMNQGAAEIEKAFSENAAKVNKDNLELMGKYKDQITKMLEEAGK